MGGAHMAYRRSGALLALTLATSATAQTKPVPAISKAEAAQLYAAGGFPIVNDQPTDACGAPARPSIRFIDMNGDRRAEALFLHHSACAAPEKATFGIAAKGTDGRWRKLVAGNGTVRALPTRTGGWLDLEWTHGGRTDPLRYNGSLYVVTGGKDKAAAIAPSTAPKPAPAPATTAAPSGDAAIFRAAGFTRRGNQWRSGCDDPGTISYSPGTIEKRTDLNGDGRPEAVVTEGGSYCYGNTGMAFWLVSQQADGSWKLVVNNTGIPEFLKSKGVGGWPDIAIGGPGFCFPVVRWNGKAYVPNRREYEGKPCR